MGNGQNNILDELAKLVTNIIGGACEIRDEIETFLQLQIEKLLNNFDLVKREEFEALKELTLKVKEENVALVKKVSTLEMQMHINISSEKE